VDELIAGAVAARVDKPLWFVSLHLYPTLGWLFRLGIFWPIESHKAPSITHKSGAIYPHSISFHLEDTFGDR
jgi:hypothetical protein